MGKSGPSPDLLDLAGIAIAAGALILEVYGRGEIAAAAKADHSPVTEADTAAECLILDRLSAVAPGIPIVSEEAVSRGIVPKIGDRFFLVDPLDGTKEFLSRNGEFTVNIALIDEGRPVAGIVYAPAAGALFAGGDSEAWAARVIGGRLEARRPTAARAPAAAGFDVLASRSHMTAETESFIRKLKVHSLVSAGSSLKFCRIAEGAADLYPRFGRTMEWDTAAGDAVLRAAGGHVMTRDGEPLTYGKRGRGDAHFENPSFIAYGAFDALALASVTSAC